MLFSCLLILLIIYSLRPVIAFTISYLGLILVVITGILNIVGLVYSIRYFRKNKVSIAGVDNTLALFPILNVVLILIATVQAVL